MNCHCCGAPLDVKTHRGVLINRKAALGARLVTVREQLGRTRDKKRLAALVQEQSEIAAEYMKLEELEKE